MHSILDQPAYHLVGAIRRREISPLHVVEACVERAEALQSTLNAFVALDIDGAIVQARELTRLLGRNHESGELIGVPVGIKDLEDVAGLPTTYGSVPFKENMATMDSIHVQRLRQAGCIILGKTNTPEFGYAAFTKNRLFGVTRNPWDPQRTSGGSSGGSAAAVASGIVPLATGTDRGGSLRIPASYTGCFGFKPTFGLIPAAPRPMLQWSDLETLGPLTRTVRDACLYLDAVCGYHPLDKDSLPTPPTRFSDLIDTPLRRLRIGWSPTLGYAAADKEVIDRCEEALAILEKLGHVVTEARALLQDPADAWTALALGERYAELADYVDEHRDEFGRGFLSRLERGKDLVSTDYGKAQRVRATLVKDLWKVFQRQDVLVTPTTPTTAFEAEGQLPVTVGGVALGNPLQVVALTYPFNLSGHPAATVPAGLADSGLPVGLQLVAPHHQDGVLLQVAHEYEEASGPWPWPTME